VVGSWSALRFQKSKKKKSDADLFFSPDYFFSKTPGAPLRKTSLSL